MDQSTTSSLVHTRTVRFQTPPLADITRRCVESQKAITRLRWALEDARCDETDEVVFVGAEVRNWIEQLKDAAVALAFASMLEEVKA